MELKPSQVIQFSRQVTRCYNALFQSMVQEAGISMREMHVLLFLANNPEVDTAREICEHRGLLKSQVSQAVELLCSLGILERVDDASDRRKVHLRITQQGQPFVKDAQRIQAHWGELLLQGLDGDQRQQLGHIMETLILTAKKMEEVL